MGQGKLYKPKYNRYLIAESSFPIEDLFMKQMEVFGRGRREGVRLRRRERNIWSQVQTCVVHPSVDSSFRGSRDVTSTLVKVLFGKLMEAKFVHSFHRY